MGFVFKMVVLSFLFIGIQASAKPIECKVSQQEINLGVKISYVGDCLYEGDFSGGDYCDFRRYSLAIAETAKRLILVTNSCTGDVLHQEIVEQDSSRVENFDQCYASQERCEEARKIYLLQKGS